MGKNLDSLPIVNFVNFNQTGTCISVGTSVGFDIFNCQPFGKFYTDKKIKEGGYSIVEMLFSTSLVALVGCGDSPHLSPRKLKLVNTKKCTVICEVTFPTSILSVKMNRSRLVVMLKEQMYIYDIRTMKLLHVIENFSNPYGLVSISYSLENNYLLYPAPSQIINSEVTNFATTNNVTIPLSRQKNGDLLNFYHREVLYNKDIHHINDINVSEDSNSNTNYTITESLLNENAGNRGSNKPEIFNSNSHNGTTTIGSNTADNNNTKTGDIIIFDLDKLQPVFVIEAHKNNIAALALSSDGTLLATASEKGTIVRVFSVESGIKLYQFRRGTYQAKIFSMSFSSDNKFLVVSCSSKTVHIFMLGELDRGNDSVLNSTVTSNNTNNNSDVESEEMVNSDDINTFSGSDITNNESCNKEPFVDVTRKTVGRIIRNSSQNLTRKAVKTLGQLLPIKVNTILEPSRHFASLKLPSECDLYIKSIASIGEVIEIDSHEYPGLFVSENKDMDKTASTKNPVDFDSIPRGSVTALPPERVVPANNMKHTLKVLPINVVTQEGYLYQYVLDPERGGDCLLLNQYSLIVN